MVKDLVPVTTEEDFGYFKDGIEFNIYDPRRHSDSSLTSLLESGSLARFDITNDALCLKRKADNKYILEVSANSAQVNHNSCSFFNLLTSKNTNL